MRATVGERESEPAGEAHQVVLSLPLPCKDITVTACSNGQLSYADHALSSEAAASDRPSVNLINEPH